MGDRAFMDNYPRMYIISNQKQMCLDQLGEWKGQGWEWNLS